MRKNQGRRQFQEGGFGGRVEFRAKGGWRWRRCDRETGAHDRTHKSRNIVRKDVRSHPAVDQRTLLRHFLWPSNDLTVEVTSTDANTMGCLKPRYFDCPSKAASA